MISKISSALTNPTETTIRLAQSHDPLARALQKHLHSSGKSIYRLSNDSGIDAAYIWRVLNDQKHEVSREVLILLSIALVLDDGEVDMITDIANDLLAAAGYKSLRARS